MERFLGAFFERVTFRRLSNFMDELGFSPNERVSHQLFPPLAILPAMAQAGPSTMKRQNKKQSKNGIRSSKVKKVALVKSIEALEEAVMQYVSILCGFAYLFVLIG